jgi:hypothetical protein
MGGHPVVKPGLFGHHTDVAADLKGIIHGIVIQHSDSAAAAQVQAQQSKNGGGFSGTVGTEQPIDITGLQVQFDAFEDFLSSNT